ncbi:MAG TPA: GNAT family N-acetyltransferase [Verrucomicrobiae bacterium]|nr:GNAT family N-acetyltransferase [Verrucomicrobiae bacterium]
MARHTIRRACESDCAGMARLATQLGYPASEDDLKLRLQHLLGSSNDLVFVAESDGAVVGWIHGFLSQPLESDRRVEIGGLVVDEKFHRQGIGWELVRRVEQWAIGLGITELVVRCRTTRQEAHQFYQSLGCRPVKTQTVFRKCLN